MSNRKPTVSDRAKRPNHMFSFCRIVGCNQPARAGTAKGLDQRYCRRHADHFGRHGSHVKRSYTAKDLAPYRKTVAKWLKVHREDPWARNAIVRIEGLYERGGAFVEAFSLRGLPAKERARKVWARLRHAGVPPGKVLAAWLTVDLAVRLDPQPDWRPEFKRVQGAKLIHRMASGSHKRWETQPWQRRPGPPPKPIVTEVHAYPHSRGRVLRHVGEDMGDACGLVVFEHGEAIERLHREC